MGRTKIPDDDVFAPGYDYEDGQFRASQNRDGTWDALVIDASLERGMWRALGRRLARLRDAEVLIALEQRRREELLADVRPIS